MIIPAPSIAANAASISSARTRDHADALMQPAHAPLAAWAHSNRVKIACSTSGGTPASTRVGAKRRVW